MGTLKCNQCTSLQSLPPSIGGCKALKELKLHGCESLASLPPTVGDLKALQVLDLSDTKIEAFPLTIGGCTSLKTLNLYYCDRLESLPDGFWQLDIKDLNLCGCEKLNMASTVDMIILHFKNMEKFSIGATDISRLPEGIGGCRALKELWLYSCKSLASLP